jgi:hypothetical protein
MKKQLLIWVFALAAFFIALTAFMIPQDKEQKNSPAEKFSKVAISVKSTVYIEQGDNYKLDIQADEKTLENIKVEYKSGELQIKCKNGCKVKDPVIINITTPVLYGISIAGSSDLFIEKTFTTDKMDLNLAGSGNMNLKDLKADKVSASIAGSGNILLAGGKSGCVEKVNIAGSGKLDAIRFEVAEADIEIAGSGDCTVFAVEKLNVSIAGSGSVLYKGKPVLQSETAGSGKVREIGSD